MSARRHRTEFAQDRASVVTASIRLILDNACIEIEAMLRDEIAAAERDAVNNFRNSHPGE
jgi:hypothetical protein